MLRARLAILRSRGASFLPKAALFGLSTAVVIALMSALMQANFVWRALNVKFAQDERYQLQTLFLPDDGRAIPSLMVGDWTFLQDLPEPVRDAEGVSSLVINAYDPDDLAAVLKGLETGHRSSKTRVCTLVVQISPLFSLRAKSTGVAQDTRILRAVYRSTSAEMKVKAFFDTAKAWAATRRTVSTLQAGDQRPPRMVGQARFASANTENWERAFGRIDRFDGQIIGVLDTRGTDWGEGSDLIAATRSKLDALAAQQPHFSWIPLEERGSLAPMGCPS